MEEAPWYYVQQGQRFGPVSTGQIVDLVRTNRLSPFEIVWREGMADWAQIRAVKDFWTDGPPPLPSPQYFTPPPRPDPGQDAGMRMLIPVGRSGWAIAAGYLGLFSVLLVFAPFAVGCSIMAIREIRRDPSKHGMGRAIFGLIMGVPATGFLIYLLAMRAIRG